MAGGHAARLAAAELREHGADLYVIDSSGVEIGVCGEGSAQDVGEELVVVGVFERALFRAGDRGSEGGEEDDVGG